MSGHFEIYRLEPMIYGEELKHPLFWMNNPFEMGEDICIGQLTTKQALSLCRGMKIGGEESFANQMIEMGQPVKATPSKILILPVQDENNEDDENVEWDVCIQRISTKKSQNGVKSRQWKPESIGRINDESAKKIFLNCENRSKIFLDHLNDFWKTYQIELRKEKIAKYQRKIDALQAENEMI